MNKITINKKGSVSLIVIIICFVIVMLLAGIYMSNINKINTSKEQEKYIKESYNQEVQIEDIYKKVEGANNEN